MSVKIAILGNSVPLLVFPRRCSLNDKTYAELLEENGCKIINASKQAVTLADVYRYLEDEVIRYFPDYLIIHLGIVEATFRARPRFLQNYFNENAWKNNIINISYCSTYKRAIQRVIKSIYKLLEKILYSLRIKWRYLSPGKFSHALKDLLICLEAHTPVKKIIIVGMLPGNTILEKLAPGTGQSIEEFNAIMRNISFGFHNTHYLNVEEILSGHALQEISPDSIHFNALGHKLLAKHILSIITDQKK